MKIYRYFTLAAILTFVIAFAAFGQEVSIPDLLKQVETELAKAREEQLQVYSPRRFNKADENFAEAKSLIERNRERELVRIKLQGALDELNQARETAKEVRTKLAAALTERTAAQQAGGEHSNPADWKRAEDKLRETVRDIERGVDTIPDGEIQEIAGLFRAIRREALRAQIIGEAHAAISSAESQGAERTFPKLLVRAHQAIGRAEAALAQEDLDAARDEAASAQKTANHIIALLKFVDDAERQPSRWEAALLPYDDLLSHIAANLGGNLDLSGGGAATEPQFDKLISQRTDSVDAELDRLRQYSASMEQSLQDCQTGLADAQNRMIQLEQRSQKLESEHTSSQGELQKRSEIRQKITEVQEMFKPGQAVVLQDEKGRVVIRVYAINFAAGQSSVDKSQTKTIAAVAKAVQEFPGAQITVEGHTDADGKDEVNQTLSEQRALSVGSALADALKIRADTLTAIGYGETRPIADNKTKEGRARNRRIDVVLTLP